MKDARAEAEHQAARATLVVEDATAIATSDTPLVSVEDKAALQQLAESLQQATVASLDENASAATIGASVTQTKALVDAARVELTRVLTAAIASSQAALDAAPLADAAVRQILVDAQASLTAANGDERPVADFVVELSTAVAAVNESQRAAAAAASAGTIKQRNQVGNDEGNTVGG